MGIGLVRLGLAEVLVDFHLDLHRNDRGDDHDEDEKEGNGRHKEIKENDVPSSNALVRSTFPIHGQW